MLTCVQLTEKEHAERGRRKPGFVKTEPCEVAAPVKVLALLLVSLETSRVISCVRVGLFLTLCKVSVLPAPLAIIKRDIYLPAQSPSFIYIHG